MTTAISRRSEPLIIETIDLLSSTSILGGLYGIAFALYCLCVRLLYLQLREPDKRRQARFTLGYVSLVLFCTTAFLVLNARFNNLAYVNHAGYPGGPAKYKVSYSTTTNSYWMLWGFFNLIVEVLTMAIQIWRLWIIWSRTQYAKAVIALPLFLLLSYITLDIPINIVNAVVPLRRLGIPLRSAIAIDTASYAVRSAFTILVTGLIAAHLLSFRRRHIRSMGMSDSLNVYVSIVAILVESYALESAWSLASAISRGLNNASVLVFTASDSTIKVIAYFLVVYRVASGRGWTTDTKRKLTSIQWNHSTETTTDEWHSPVRSRGFPSTIATATASRITSNFQPIV